MATATPALPGSSAVQDPLPVIKKKKKEEEEPADEYVEGGYLPIITGTCFQGRYVVIRKLGWGHFSTVWLVKDLKRDRHAALKVVKSARNYYETARDEIVLLNHVASVNKLHPGHRHIISFLDSFSHPAPTSRKLEHQCMVFEPLGPNLLTLLATHKEQSAVTQSGGLPIDLVRVITKQILLGVQYLHEECRLIHTDIKPENILVTIPDVEAVVVAELAASTETKSRVVGIPQQSYQFTPRRNTSVHIFESQPLPSPRYTSSTSVSPVDSLALQMSTITTSSPATSLGTDPTSSSSYRSTRADFKGKGKETHVGELHTVKEHTSPHVVEGPSLLSTTNPRNIDSCCSGAGETLAYLPAPPPDRLPRPIAGHANSSTFSVKIADLGNATPIVKHFTNDIQTRQYRAPEILLGRDDWDQRADMWSVACVIFEMLTSDYLFDPRANGSFFSKDDDHMAQMMELLGDFDWDFKMGGRYSREIFNRKGHLRYIRTLRLWPLTDVLTDKYLFPYPQAKAIADFLKPMLAFNPRERASAREVLAHPWLK